jgi:hypothetical protein
MASERQIAANRRNAKKSTGPISSSGKSRSRQNALRHGLATSADRDPLLSADVNQMAQILSRARGEPQYHLDYPGRRCGRDRSAADPQNSCFDF